MFSNLTALVLVVATSVPAASAFAKSHPAQQTTSNRAAHTQFPSFEDVRTLDRWSDLARIMDNSGIGEAEWETLSEEQKAGLLNIYAKLQSVVVDGESLVKSVESVSSIHPERIYTVVRADLMDRVSRDAATFHEACPLLHTGERGWKLIDSYKTKDAMGNLELTFARDAEGRLVADIDIDNHLGFLHGFDVIKHVVTGKETNPYEIREILVTKQSIDPGYELVTVDVEAMTTAQGNEQ
jgi:hypothetical protein